MGNISLTATKRSPAVEFDFAGNRFSIAGESYPEDVSIFYGPLLERLQTHLAAQSGSPIEFRFQFLYFNSSSAKIIMELFEVLEVAAARNQVRVIWAYQQDDDNIQELGEEFGEELSKAEFILREVAPGEPA